tara:strand:- start:36 stop:761 length:726 start_codon:yes stop_codon:yes gene_type:complete
MMSEIYLIVLSFVTSAFTAVIGMGGGIMLISLMPGLLPVPAVVPVHGVVQLASNASRVALGLRHVEWRIFWPFVGGAVLGAGLGSRFVLALPTDYFPVLLGSFILLVVWMPKVEVNWRLPGKFIALGAVQTFLSLFIGVGGPLTSSFLWREGLGRERIVLTHAAAMSGLHCFKVLAFGLLGFVFQPYLTLIVAMIVSVSLGSFVGTRLRRRVPETAFRAIYRTVVTVLALRLIAVFIVGGD